MEEKSLHQYDAHVKTHQRYILMKLLDETKNEAMEKLLKQKTSLPEGKVSVPRPQTALPPLNFEVDINQEDYDINTFQHISAQILPLVSDYNLDMVNLKNIVPRAIKPAKVNFADGTRINPELFSDISNGRITMPQFFADYLPTVTPIEALELLPLVDAPTVAFSYKLNFDNSVFPSTIQPKVNFQRTVFDSEKLDFSIAKDVAPLQIPLSKVNAPSIEIVPSLSGDDVPVVIFPQEANEFSLNIISTETQEFPRFELDTSHEIRTPNIDLSYADILPLIMQPEYVGKLKTADIPKMEIELPNIKSYSILIPETKEIDNTYIDKSSASSIQLPKQQNTIDFEIIPQDIKISIPNVPINATSIPEPVILLPPVLVPQPKISKNQIPQISIESFSAVLSVPQLPVLNDVLEVLSKEEALMKAQ